MNEALEIEEAKKDPRQFEVLYDRYYENVFRFCYQRAKDLNLAKDLASQVFLKAMLGLNKYQHKNKAFSSWLITIAFNEVSNYYRKIQKDRTVRIEYESVKVLFGQVEIEDSSFDLHLGKALNALNRNDLDLIEMKYFEGRSHEEIGQILNISISNARIRLHRAMDKLKKLFIESLKPKVV